MADTLIHLEIVTPKKVFFKGEVKSITAPGIEGQFQILPRHAPFISTLVPGKVKVISKDGVETIYATSGGTLEVNKNKIIFLAETIEAASEIDIKRAEESKQRALKRLEEKTGGLDYARAKESLMRAAARLKAAGV